MTDTARIEVGAITATDAADLHRFWTRHRLQLSPHLVLPDTELAWGQCLSEPSARWYVARIAAQTVAVGVLARISGWPWHTGEVGVGVDPEWRGRGIGRATLGAIFDAGFRSGLARIEALVDPNNVASMRMVAAAGMVNEGISGSAIELAGVRIDAARWAVTCNSSRGPTHQGISPALRPE